MASTTDQPKINGGKYIVLSEVNIVVTSLRRNVRIVSHGHQNDQTDPLVASFTTLKNALNTVDELYELEASTFLNPFLEVIRSEDTSGPITGLALSTINKFLTYNLIDETSPVVASAVSSMADAVTHARFVGTDPSNDEVVLMKILQVLRTLLLAPVGVFLTNEAVCEIMQSCFRICFEMRLSELLRKSAEHTLIDMVSHLFARLPEFKEDLKGYNASAMKRLKMRASGMSDSRKKSRKSSKKKKKQISVAEEEEEENSSVRNDKNDVASVADSGVGSVAHDDATPTTETANHPPSEKIEEGNDTTDQNNSVLSDNNDLTSASCKSLDEDSTIVEESEVSQMKDAETPGSDAPDNYDLASQCTDSVPEGLDELGGNSEQEYVSNPRGVRFTTSPRTGEVINVGPLVSYSLPCVRELFRFLVSLTNPHDRHNSDVMVHMGLSLLMVTLEISRNEMGRFPSILTLIKDDMCRYLFQLLGSQHLALVASSLRVATLLFESLREHLKFQLESFLKKLMDLITSDNPKLMYEMKELSLEAIVQMWHIPGFVTELYLNYDCDYYCSNLFEDLSKLLSKNAFPVAGLYTTHLLSLDALLTVVRSIEDRCSAAMINLENIESDNENMENGIGQEKVNNSDLTLTSTEPEVVTSTIAIETKKVPLRFTTDMPSVDELVVIKHKKKLLQTGTEFFNQKPKKGISFLQEKGLLANPLDTREVTQWLRDNPWLDKKMIGEYISDRRNPEILDSFVRTFKFEGLRVDESLRLYLETFRLPGEAPVIQRLLEAYSSAWSESNHHPFMNLDAAFTLAYSVIMLNTDQHNRNVRKQNIPMNFQQFKRNLKKCNGGEDFDESMLEEIFTTIRNDEIVLPDEQTGPVRDRWLWNLSLRRGSTNEGLWWKSPDPKVVVDGGYPGLHTYDRDLFTMVWGPTVAALSFVFDKSHEENFVQQAITGFQKCALISAHFGISDVFDNLIISLCKFTTLTNPAETPEMSAILLGSNPKAQLAARTAFKLAHRHGDILREGWRNILDVLLPLFRAKMLPPSMVEVEDFEDPTGRISLIREEMPMQRTDSSIFSSFYKYMMNPGENSNQKQNSPEEQQAMKVAQECVKDLHIDQIITESKFLRLDSLQELIKALVIASRGHADPHEHTTYSEDGVIFFLELLLRVVLQNRDRIRALWQPVRDHLYSLIVSATDYSLPMERAVVGIIRLAIRLLHREDIAEQVLASMQILLMIKPHILPKVNRQISYGLHELLRTNAANIHSRDDWTTLFTLEKCVGAGAIPPPVQVQTVTNENAHDTSATGVQATAELAAQQQIRESGAQSDSEVLSDDRNSQYSDRGYTSDSEMYESSLQQPTQPTAHLQPTVAVEVAQPKPQETESEVIPPPKSPPNQFTLQLGEELRQHDMRSMVKCCETLAFLVRDAAHITPDNFELCVRCIRTFVEASINGVNRAHHTYHPDVTKQDKKRLKKRKDRDNKRISQVHDIAANGRNTHGQYSDDDSSQENVPGGYHTISLQLLDLMHTLHTRAASIYSSWAREEESRLQQAENSATDHKPAISAEASTLWDKCWCPLLQGIARLCCDARRQVRTSALTYLQRALLVHDLQTLTGKEWESCFNKVLFPLLTKLLENISPADPVGMEETRMRGATLLSKVFLQHLTPLLTLPTFTALWLTILDFMDRYMHVGRSDLLFEAVPESLKNMLLVMDTARIFHNSDNPNDYTSLWDVTWERIDCFLPNLKNEVFKPPSHEPVKPELTAPTAPELSRENVPEKPVAQSTKNYEEISSIPFNQFMNAPNVLPPDPKNCPPAGIVPLPHPKVTPPTSLNLDPPYQTPANVIPLYPVSHGTQAPVSLNPPKAPVVLGLGSSLVQPLQSPQSTSPTPSGSANILVSPASNFVLHPPTLLTTNEPISPINIDTQKPLTEESQPTMNKPPILLNFPVTSIAGPGQ